jgi:hypothetical protein
LSRYLSGATRILPQTMPVDGSLIAVNYLHEVAPADASAIGTMGSGTATPHLFRSQACGSIRQIPLGWQHEQ